MLKRMMLLAALTTVLAAPAAFADHRDARYLPAHRLESLADDVTDAARDMRSAAAHRLRRPGPRNHSIMIALDDLAVSAARFERTVRRGASPRRLDRSFDVLRVSFNRAERAMWSVRSGRLQREFRQVERAMIRLDRRFDVASVRPHHRQPRHRDRARGSIVYGDRFGDADVRVRIRF